MEESAYAGARGPLSTRESPCFSLPTILFPGGPVQQQDETGVSRSSGRPIAFGYTPDGRYICVVYEEIAPYTLYPVTAFEIKE